MRISTCPCGNQFAGFGSTCGPCKDRRSGPGDLAFDAHQDSRPLTGNSDDTHDGIRFGRTDRAVGYPYPEEV